MAKLTPEQHLELARLLNQAADNITAATRIVGRATFSDRALYVEGSLQEWLIDPLREAFEELGLHKEENPYQSVGYGGPHKRKEPPSKPCVPR